MRSPSRSSFATALAERARALLPHVSALPDTFGSADSDKAQLLACGLFAARVMASDLARASWDRASVREQLQCSAQPFDAWLCGALDGLCSRSERAALDEIVALLGDSSVAAWLARAKQPLLEVYEPFLAALQPERRRAHGVYFTPPELCQYVVERVDAILRDELGIALGLADARSFQELGVHHARPTAAAVRVLDPAAGCGAFLTQVISCIHARMSAHHRSLGMSNGEQQTAWQGYVAQALLPRLLGFELLPAAHTLCQLQLRVALAVTGYRLRPEDRIQVQRADALAAMADALHGRRGAHSALLLDAAPVTVIVGNPPYARRAAADNETWRELLTPYTRAVSREKNLQPLADDYVRFVRGSECLLARAPFGVAGLVTSSTYLHGHLHSGMRASLTQTFSRVDVLDLGGSSKQGSRLSGGARDENVFEVAQGIATSFFRRGIGAEPRVVRHATLRGKRAAKLGALALGQVDSWTTLQPSAPEHLLVPQRATPPEYAQFVSLLDLFATSSIGCKPGNDAMLVAFDAAAACDQLRAGHARVRADPSAATTEAARKLRELTSLPAPLQAVPYAYRPFDTRYVCDAPQVWTRAVQRLRAAIDGSPILLAARFARDADFAHVFVTRLLPDVIFLSNKSSVNCFAFPRAALSVERLSCAAITTRADAFAYVYAVLHAPSFRQRYTAALASGFARVPVAPAPRLARELTAHGQQLIALHLLEGEVDPALRPTFVDGGDRRLRRSQMSRHQLTADASGCVSVALNARARFTGVPLAVWEFRVGGYQVCHKWLLDRLRAGRELSDADLVHYQTMVAVIAHTLRIMNQIDQAIAAHGGWRRAFSLERAPTPSPYAP